MNDNNIGVVDNEPSRAPDNLEAGFLVEHEVPAKGNLEVPGPDLSLQKLKTYMPLGTYASYRAIESIIIGSTTSCSSAQVGLLSATLGIFGLLAFFLSFACVDKKKYRFKKVNGYVIGHAFVSIVAFAALTLPMAPVTTCLYPQIPSVVSNVLPSLVAVLMGIVATFLLDEPTTAPGTGELYSNDLPGN